MAGFPVKRSTEYRRFRKRALSFCPWLKPQAEQLHPFRVLRDENQVSQDLRIYRIRGRDRNLYSPNLSSIL